MRPDLTYVYPTGPNPYSLTTSNFRRPRTCPCRSHQRVTPICKADDDRQWFGLKTWFRQDDNGRKDVVIGHEEDVQKSPDGTKNNGTVSKGNEASNGSGAKNEEDRGFRWPWQKHEDPVEEDSMTGLRRASHSDSNPSSSARRRVEEQPPDREKDRITLQERWRRVVDVIAPGFSKEEESQNNEDNEDEKRDNVVIGESKKLERAKKNSPRDRKGDPQSRHQDNQQKSSIAELYQPPARKPVPKEQESWFKLPWKKVAKPAAEEKDKLDEITEVPSKINETEIVVRSEEEKKTPLMPKSAHAGEGMSAAEKEASREEKDSEESPKKGVQQKKPDTAVILRTGKTSSSRSPLVDLVPVPQRDVAAIRLIFGSETFFATETLSAPGGLIFRGNLRGEPKATVAKLEKQLASRLGDKYTLCLAEGDEDLRPVVVVVPTARDKRPASPRQKFMALVLTLMTASTCLGRGLFAVVLKPTIHALHGPPPRDHLFYPFFGTASRTSLTIAVAIGFIVILSQLLQRIVGSRYRTRVAIPFLLPSYQLGSFGAVVQVASPTPTRAALFDIALSGAATLVILSMACLLLGLRMSTSFSQVIPVPMSVVSKSVVMGFLTQQVPDGKILIDYGRSLIGLHPLAVIGANCLTIAALNLLPIRQLDGGRIISALYGRRTAVHASRVTVLFLLLASSKSPYFIVFLAAITFGPWLPDRPSRNELTEPDGLRTIVGYLFMLLMIGILLPFPASKFFGTL